MVGKFECLLLAILLSLIEVNAQKTDFGSINFNKADSIAKLHGNLSLKNMPLLVHNLTYQLDTEVEQFRAIHTWICLNIESDHYFSERILSKRKQLIKDSIAFNYWNSQIQSKVVKKLIKQKKTICSGYAYLVKALASLADIECNIVHGYARNATSNVDKVDFANHSWNVVKLHGKWYFADTTQASGFYDLDAREFVKDYNDGFFLASPELFVKNHYPLHKKWLLTEENISLEAFVKSPIIYVDTFKHGVIPITPVKLVSTLNMGDAVIFRYKLLDKAALTDFKLTIGSGMRFKTIKPVAAQYKDNILELRYNFSKRGHYDVHAKVGEDIVVSYSIIVKKPEKLVLKQT